MMDKAEFNSNYEIFDREVVKEIIEIFISEHPGRMDDLQKNIQEQDIESLHRNAHSLKGIIANFFDKETEEIASIMEINSMESYDSNVESQFEQLKINTEILLKDLKILLKDYQ
jgi:HPt (histidine-containing phosphotransfer) domain-containing protein